MTNFEELFNAYVTAALWSSTTGDDDGTPLDQDHDESDIDSDTMETMEAFCRVFYFREACFIRALHEQHTNKDALPYLDMLAGRGASLAGFFTSAGHDLWLNQNGHGVGFWAREELWKCYADKFSKHAENLGGVELYIGDDGKIYA